MKSIIMSLGLLAIAGTAHANPARDCMLEGTVKKNPADSEKVYIAFHSAKPAEEGARCRMRKEEKLQFKAPASDLQDAEPGTRVRYRFTEDEAGNSDWKRNRMSS